MSTLTRYLSLSLFAENELPYYKGIINNLQDIDVILHRWLIDTKVRGRWKNTTAYTQEECVIDGSTSFGKLYICRETHVSPSTGSLADDIAANPTHWEAAIDQINALQLIVITLQTLYDQLILAYDAWRDAYEIGTPTTWYSSFYGITVGAGSTDLDVTIPPGETIVANPYIPNAANVAGSELAISVAYEAATNLASMKIETITSFDAAASRGLVTLAVVEDTGFSPTRSVKHLPVNFGLTFGVTGIAGKTIEWSGMIENSFSRQIGTP